MTVTAIERARLGFVPDCACEAAPAGCVGELCACECHDPRPMFGPAPLDVCTVRVAQIEWHQGAGWTIAPVQKLWHMNLCTMIRPRVGWGCW